jgi:hypothetical protein
MKKTRHIISERLFAPKKCCDGQNERAIAFKRAIYISAKTEILNPDIAVKAAMSIGDSYGGGEKRTTYEDTDNRKRDFSGDLPPGLEKDELGNIWDKNKKYTPGDRLVLFPNRLTRNRLPQTPNFGWISPPAQKNVEKSEENEPVIVLKKYKVNPKTDDIIPSTEKILNPLNHSSGDSMDDFINGITKSNKINTKILPGRPLKDRIPGGRLIARAAAMIGIITDANNKFRCPPGTPAANQFTDMRGTTCFGFSASRFAKFAAEKAVELTDAGELQGFKRFVSRAMNWVNGGSWDDDQGISNLPVNRPIEYFFGRTPGFDPVTGTTARPDWASADVPDSAGGRTFKNTMIEGQRRIDEAKKIVDDLMSSLGVDTSAPARENNSDIYETFDRLKENGQWDVQIERLDDNEVRALVVKELRRRFRALKASGETTLTFDSLPPEIKESLIKSETARFRVTERAVASTILEQFALMPEHMKKIKTIRLTKNEPGTKHPDEGSFGFMQNAETGEIASSIFFNFDTILENQTKNVPGIKFDERLLVTAIDGMSDAERAEAVADFITSANDFAKNRASLVSGVESFSRFIALHEIGHSIQGEAFVAYLKRNFDETGKLEFVDSAGKLRSFTSITEMTASDFNSALVAFSRDAIESNPALKEQLLKLADVYGKYPRGYLDNGGSGFFLLEAQAEMWAMREMGLIHGDDIDLALSSMDEYENAELRKQRLKKASSIVEESKEKRKIESMKRPWEKTDKQIDSDMKKIKDRIKDREGTDNSDLLNIAAVAELEMDDAKNNYDLASKEYDRIKEAIEKGEDVDFDSASKLDVLASAKENAKKDFEYFKKIREMTKKEWMSRNTIGDRGASREFEDALYKFREEKGILKGSEKAEIVEKLKIQELKAQAERLDDKSLVDDYTNIMSIIDKGEYSSPEEYDEMLKQSEILLDEYIRRARAAGDTRRKSTIRKSLLEKVDEKSSPKSKKIKKFKSGADAKNHAQKERKNLRRKISKEQAQAVREMGDFKSNSISRILHPESNAQSGRAMNRANARLRRLGLEIDKKTTSDGSMEDQVKNILIPTMEAMDLSSASEPFEMEAIIELEPGELSGKALGKEFDHKGFVNGRVISKGHKKGDVSKKKNPQTGKKQNRVIVTVKEGDRGIFPSAGADEKQMFVIPPGKMRVIGRDPDGTVRVEISSQKGTTEVLDDLARDLAEGSGDAIWRKSAAAKIQKISDKRVVDVPSRLSSGRTSVSKDKEAVSRELVKSLKDKGSTFGSYSEVDDMMDEIKDPDSPMFLLKGDTDVKINNLRTYFERSVPKGDRESFMKHFEQTMSEIEKLIDRSSTKGSMGQVEPPEFVVRIQKEIEKNLVRLTTRDFLGKDPYGEQQFVDEDGVEYGWVTTSRGGGKGRWVPTGRTGRKPTPFFPVQKIDKDELDPKVENLISTSSTKEIEKIIEQAAIRFHQGLDSRPRVRMRESELDDFAETGKIRATKRTGSSAVSGISRRTERLSSGAERTYKPGAIKDEIEFAEKAKEKIIELYEKVDPPVIPEGTSPAAREEIKRNHLNNFFASLTDVQLSAMGLEKLYDENGNPKVSVTTGQIVFAVKNAEMAIAMLAMGQTVRIDDGKRKDEPRMVENAANQINKLLKDVKDSKGILQTIDLCRVYSEGDNVWCSENIGVDRKEMPQVGGMAADHRSLAMRLWKSQFATAETINAHFVNSDGKKLKKELKITEQIKKLRQDGKVAEADELEKAWGRLEGICHQHDGVSSKKLNGKDEIKIEYKIDGKKIKETISPEEARAVMERFGVKLTGKDIKELGERWNREGELKKIKSMPDGEEKEKLLEKFVVFQPLSKEEKELFFSHLDYPYVEPDGLDQFIDFLDLLNVKVDSEEIVSAKTLKASQRQIDAGKTDMLGEVMKYALKDILKEYEKILETDGKEAADLWRENEIAKLRREHGLFKKIIISSDGYIVDGHHRVVGRVLSDAVEDNPLLQLGMTIRRVDMPIVELLTVSRVYQDHLGLKPASLEKGAPETYIEQGIDAIQEIDKDTIDAMHGKLLFELDDRLADIYDKGTFIQVESVGLRQKSSEYVDALLEKRRVASLKTRFRRKKSPGTPVEEFEEKVKQRSQKGELVESGSGRLSSGAEKQLDAGEVAKQLRPIDYISKRVKLEKSIDKEFKNSVDSVFQKINKLSASEIYGAKSKYIGNKQFNEYAEKFIKSLPGTIPEEEISNFRKLTKAVGELVDKYAESKTMRTGTKSAARMIITALKIILDNKYFNNSMSAIMVPGTGGQGAFTFLDAWIDTGAREISKSEGIKSVIDMLVIAAVLGISRGPRATKLLKKYFKKDKKDKSPSDSGQRLSSGLAPPGKRNALNSAQKILKKTNINSESSEKIMFAYSGILNYEKGSTNTELETMARRVKFNSGETITKMMMEKLVDADKITEEQKTVMIEKLGLNINDFDGMESKSKAIKNAFNDGIDALDFYITNQDKEEYSGRKVGYGYAKRKFGPDEFDIDEEDVSTNMSLSALRRGYWADNGLNENIQDDEMPVSGYLIHNSQIEAKKKMIKKNGSINIDDDAIFEIGDSDIFGDGLTAQGEIEVVLSPEVSSRTAYGRGSALKNGQKPVSMRSASRRDIAQALVGSNQSMDTQAAINMLAASFDNDFSAVASRKPSGSRYKQIGQSIPEDFEHEQIQAHILGGFDKDEVESINYPFSKIQKLSQKEDLKDIADEKSIAAMLRKAGFTEAEIKYFYSISDGKPFNTQSMQALKSYRAAQKIREKYKRQGFNKINFAHPQGINIDNPATYNINATPSQSVEEVLKKNIAKEIAEQAKRVLREMRSNTIPNFEILTGRKK